MQGKLSLRDSLRELEHPEHIRSDSLHHKNRNLPTRLSLRDLLRELVNLFDTFQNTEQFLSYIKNRLLWKRLYGLAGFQYQGAKNDKIGEYMNEKFFDLKKEKQDRMINAALKIFASNGYKHASTDDIVSEAGISKGLLFHYFGSKLGLYTFLYDYSVRFMKLELTTGVSSSADDYFAIRKQIEFAKMQVLKNYPYMQQFLDRCASENVSEALMATESQRSVIQDVYAALKNQADSSRFVESVSPEKLDAMLDYTISGLMTTRFRDDSFQPEMLYEEIVSYLEMLKRISYRKS